MGKTTYKPAPGATLGDSPVTLTLSQLNELQASLVTAETAVTRLEGELAQARAADPTGRIGRLTTLVRDGLLPIVRFAVANLPPMEIPKWPWRAVLVAATSLDGMPDFSQDDDVLANELALFAQDVQQHELLRARKRDELIESAPGKPLKVGDTTKS